MSPESIPQISLGTAAVMIFVVCAAYVMLRGMTRMLMGTLVLAASAWIGFRVWQQAPSLSIEWFGKPLDFVIISLPVAAFFASFYLIRKLAKFVLQPFGRPAGEPLPRSSNGMALRLLFAIIPAGLLWLIGATMVHHAGSIAEIRSSVEKSCGIGESTAMGFSQRLKASVEAALPESWLQLLDPLAEPGRLALAKLIAIQPYSSFPPVIDPETGKPYPRAIVVDDSELQGLARQQDFSTLLHHPYLSEALNDPKVRKAIKDKR
jgi:hypothetical protein